MIVGLGVNFDPYRNTARLPMTMFNSTGRNRLERANRPAPRERIRTARALENGSQCVLAVQGGGKGIQR